MSEVLHHDLKPKAECEGNRETCKVDGCPLFGTLGPASRDGKRRVRGCNDPVARGKRNRRKGKDGERDMRKRTGSTVPTTMHAAIGEEAWSNALFRDECKSGAQVGPIATRFLAAERQSDQQRRIGDNRVFRFLARPDGMSDGLVCVRGNVWKSVVEPALQAFYGYEEAS